MVDHAPKSIKYLFTKLGRLTARHPKEGAEILLKLLFLTLRPVLRKKQRALLKEKREPKCLILDLGALVGTARPKSTRCQITKVAGLTVRNPGEGAKIIFKILFLRPRRDLS